ncbi:ribosome small subunit-dependent GTPase A [Planctomycetota bacterium]
MAKITGKQMFNALSREDYPAVGDWVTITDLGEQQAVIHQILPRKTIIKRKASGKNDIQVIAANIDVAFVIESVDRDYNLNRFERYFAITRDGGIIPAIILNKIDLISNEELESRIDQIKNRFGDIDFITTSTVNNEGLDELKAYIAKGKTYCFLGSSGVGKSSLINKLIGKEVIKTSQISTHTDRGRHTTTSREMYFLENGGIVIDNPGMREVGMTDVGDGIDSLFDEIISLARKCKYVDCTHIHEPGCAVLSAIKTGRLDEDRYNNYLGLKKEAEYYEMTELEKKQKNSQFGKFVKKAKKELRRYGHKDY